MEKELIRHEEVHHRFSSYLDDLLGIHMGGIGVDIG